MKNSFIKALAFSLRDIFLRAKNKLQPSAVYVICSVNDNINLRFPILCQWPPPRFGIASLHMFAKKMEKWSCLSVNLVASQSTRSLT